MLKICNLNYTYKEGSPYEKIALIDINLTIEKGKIYSIIGHTGSGKSTLLQLLIGLISPTSGEVLYNGKNIFDKDVSLREIRSKIGLVFQYPEYQLFEETVEKDIGFAPKNLGLDDEEIKARVLGALELVGLEWDLLQKSPFELSGGQKRRVAIAGVVAMEPDVLVLDEPTAGLDPGARDDILGKIAELNKVYNMTIILVSHSMEDVAKYADKVIVMNEGKIFTEGTPKEVYSKYDELEKIGLSAPQITKLIDKLTGEKVCTVEEGKQLLLSRIKGKKGEENA